MNSLLLCNLTEGQQNRLIVYLKMFLFATLVFVECYEAFSVCVPTVAKPTSSLIGMALELPNIFSIQ